MTYGSFIERYCPNIRKLHIRFSTTFTNQNELLYYLEAINTAYIPSISSLDKFIMDIYDYNEDQMVPIITHAQRELSVKAGLKKLLSIGEESFPTPDLIRLQEEIAIASINDERNLGTAGEELRIALCSMLSDPWSKIASN